MNFEAASVKITGNPGVGGWAQVHDFKPSDALKLQARGHLFAVIAGSYESLGVESVALRREIISRLQEEYFGDLETSAFYALQDAVSKVINEFTDSLDGNIEVAAASYTNGILYTACGGGAQASVFRNNSLGKILISTAGKVVSASGYPQENDIFILGSAAFFRGFTDGSIRANVETKSLEKINEAFAGTIHSLPESGNYGVVIISFRESPVLSVVGTPNLEDNRPFVEGKKPLLIIPGFTKPRLANILNKLLDKFPRRVYVRRSDIDLGGEKNRKTVLSVGVALLILLFVSIGFGIKQKKVKEFKTTYITELTSAQHNFDEAQKLLALNPERARELFSESRNSVANLLSRGIKDPSIDVLNQKINESSGTILGEYKSPPELYLDLTLLSSGFKADRLSANATDMVFLDAGGRKIVAVTIESKKSKVVAGPDQIQTAADLAIYADKVYVLSQEGIFEVGDEATKKIERDWGEPSFIYAYAGNIYLIDTGEDNIYRFIATQNGFAKRQNWLAETGYDFGDFVSWAIDGSIWVAKKDGQILRFTQGVRNAFNLQGVFPEISNLESIYTNEELKFLYLLDRENGRIVAVDKNGEFKAQYLDTSLKNAQKLAVSESERKMIFLTGDSKLYWLEIKHL